MPASELESHPWLPVHLPGLTRSTPREVLAALPPTWGQEVRGGAAKEQGDLEAAAMEREAAARAGGAEEGLVAVGRGAGVRGGWMRARGVAERAEGDWVAPAKAAVAAAVRVVSAAVVRETGKAVRVVEGMAAVG